MARRPITPQFYDQLLAAFRERPGEFAPAGRRAICDERTAKRAWFQGWPELGFPPIIKALEAEQEKARAEMQRREIETKLAMDRADEETRNAAVAQALKARAEVGEVLKGARAVALGNLAAIARITPGILLLADRIKTDLKELSANPVQPSKFDAEGNVLEMKRFSTRELLEMSQRYMHLSDSLSKQAQRTVQMERLYLGLPTEIVGVQEMPLEEAIAEIEGAYHELEQARARGLVALDGGKARNAQAEPSTAAG